MEKKDWVQGGCFLDIQSATFDDYCKEGDVLASFLDTYWETYLQVMFLSPNNKNLSGVFSDLLEYAELFDLRTAYINEQIGLYIDYCEDNIRINELTGPDVLVARQSAN